MQVGWVFILPKVDEETKPSIGIFIKFSWYNNGI
jgi:hypothetical protein